MKQISRRSVLAILVLGLLVQGAQAGKLTADMKEGKRQGLWTPLMLPVLAGLGAGDILDLSAYLASLPP